MAYPNKIYDYLPFICTSSHLKCQNVNGFVSRVPNSQLFDWSEKVWLFFVQTEWLRFVCNVQHKKQKVFHISTIFSLNHLIRERTPARLSVFWNSARISLLTSSGVNSLAKSPFPDAQRSSISRKLALSTTIISVKRFHFHTYLTISPLEVWKNIF